MKNENTVKVVLALMLFICLADMPYGYYQLVRFVSMAGFGFLAHVHLERGEQGKAYIYLMLALLFQPFFKVSLGRDLWNLVDVVVGGMLLLSVASNSKEEAQS